MTHYTDSKLTSLVLAMDADHQTGKQQEFPVFVMTWLGSNT